MKDFFKVEKTSRFICYLDKDGLLHKLNGPAYENIKGLSEYYIENNLYMDFLKPSNELIIHIIDMLEISKEYHIYIKQNIKNLIEQYNPDIKLCESCFIKEKINEIPDFIKDLIIL